MALRDHLIPLIVAAPIFLQNIDTTVMATALPTIAQSLGIEPLRLNLAITAYVISLAVFLPLSGWCAERFGARRVFCAAIACFALGSGLCGLASTLPQLVACRVVQGLGGAMMVPVGRLILMRSIDAAGMVSAMVWFTIPPVVGRLMGPLFGGAIVGWTSWRWIFLVNVPFALIAIGLARAYIPDVREDRQPRAFDARGFVLLAVGMTGLQVALDTVGHGIAPVWFSVAVATLALAATAGYLAHARRHPQPLLSPDIVAVRTYRASIFGGMPLRIAIGASPFLLSLMFQIGFGLSPLQAGSLIVATAIGSLATRAVVGRAIRRFGFRPLLVATALATSLLYAIYGQFRADTPHALIFTVLIVGGLINAMGMVSLQLLGYVDMPRDRLSDATTFATMMQQLSVGFGVLLGSGLLAAAAHWRGGDPAALAAADFAPAFAGVALVTLISAAAATRLRADDGQVLRQGR